MTKELQPIPIHTGETPADPLKVLFGNTYVKPFGEGAAQWIEENVPDKDRLLWDEDGTKQHVVWKVDDEQIESAKRAQVFDSDTKFEIYAEIATGVIRKISV